MYASAVGLKEENQTRAAANYAAREEGAGKPRYGFVDNRPDAAGQIGDEIMQRKTMVIQRMITTHQGKFIKWVKLFMSSSALQNEFKRYVEQQNPEVRYANWLKAGGTTYFVALNALWNYLQQEAVAEVLGQLEGAAEKLGQLQQALEAGEATVNETLPEPGGGAMGQQAQTSAIPKVSKKQLELEKFMSEYRAGVKGIEKIDCADKKEVEVPAGMVSALIEKKGAEASIVITFDPKIAFFNGRKDVKTKFIQTVEGSPAIMGLAVERANELQMSREHLVQKGKGRNLTIDRQGAGDEYYPFFGQQSDKKNDQDPAKLIIGDAVTPAMMNDSPSIPGKLDKGKTWHPRFETLVVANIPQKLKMGATINEWETLAKIKWEVEGEFVEHPHENYQLSLGITKVKIASIDVEPPSKDFIAAMKQWNLQEHTEKHVIN